MALDDPAADSAPVAAPRASDSEPPLVLDAAGRQKLVEEAAGKSARQVRRMLADLAPELAVLADRVRPLGDGRYELKAVIDADCQQALEQLRGLLSHVDPRMTIGQLVGRIVQEALDRHDPSGCRAGRAPAAGRRRPTPRPLRRRRSKPPRSRVTLRRSRTRRLPPAPLRQRRSGRPNRAGRVRRTADPLRGDRPAP